MKSLPKYDVSPMEQEIIDQIPAVVATKDVDAVISKLKDMYLDEANKPYQSALAIIEKYLFRAYELLYFVKDNISDFDFEEYFFDEESHNNVMAEVYSKLDVIRAEEAFLEGKFLTDGEMYTEAAEAFFDSAVGGSPNGALHYGIALFTGKGCKMDDLLAAFWFWVAALNNNSMGMINLGQCYREGMGVHVDEMSLLYWYMNAYLHGEDEAAITLGTALVRDPRFSNFHDIGNHILITLMSGTDPRSTLEEFFENLKKTVEIYIYNRKF